MLTLDQCVATLGRLSFREGWVFEAGDLVAYLRTSERGGPVLADRPFLRIRFWRQDVDTDVWGWGYSAPYPLWECETARDVVQTAFKAVLNLLEHEAREQFCVDDVAVLAPHGLGLGDMVALGRKRVRH